MLLVLSKSVSAVMIEKKVEHIYPDRHYALCYPTSELTYLPLDKMVSISQTIFSDAFFVNENFYVLITISLKFVP